MIATISPIHCFALSAAGLRRHDDNARESILANYIIGFSARSSLSVARLLDAPPVIAARVGEDASSTPYQLMHESATICLYFRHAQRAYHLRFEAAVTSFAR